MTKPEEVVRCPISTGILREVCAVRSCMYFRRGEPANCGHSRLSTALEESGDRKSRRESVLHFFRMDDQDLDVSVRRVTDVLWVNEFFTFIYGKSVDEAKAKELDQLADLEAEFNEWKSTAKKISFQELLTAASFLKSNLR